MDLDSAKNRLTEIEHLLSDRAFVEFALFEGQDSNLRICITERLRKRCRRGRIWKARPMLTALKNAEYGFVSSRARSRGGTDGVFLLDRSFRPPNTMMRKIFDQFLDNEASEATAIAQGLETEVSNLHGARLVSHHLRLLGVLHRTNALDHLVLVDYDDAR